MASGQSMTHARLMGAVLPDRTGTSAKPQTLPSHQLRRVFCCPPEHVSILHKEVSAQADTMTMFQVIQGVNVPIKAWTNGVPLEDSARQQLINVSSLPFIHKHIAVMPDVHWGMGATVGSVIPTKGAIVPAAVGV